MLQPHIQAGEYKKTSLLWGGRLECMYVCVSGGEEGGWGWGDGDVHIDCTDSFIVTFTIL